MQQIIKNKTLELLNRLSDQHMYYTPTDLIDAGYPEFLVERIRLEIERNLADSVSLPESEWADMRADQVQDAWDHFLIAIRAETRIPVAYCQSVIENAVEDVLDLFSKPRNYILETLFRNENEAGFDELISRRKWIVVHGVLADSILRYMQRKNLTTLTREKAEYILVEVDKKLTSGFTPLKWAQHLDILFQFLENQVPSHILSEYFVDRGMLSEAKQINRGKEIVNRSSFIEMISEAGIYADDDLNDSPFIAARNQPSEDTDSTNINDTTNRVDFTIAPDFSNVNVDQTEIKEDESDSLTLEQAFELDQQGSSINDFNSDEEDPFDFDESSKATSGERLDDTKDNIVNEELDYNFDKVDAESQQEVKDDSKDLINEENNDEILESAISNDSHEQDTILNQFLQPDETEIEPVEEKSNLSDVESEQFVSLADQFLENSGEDSDDLSISQSLATDPIIDSDTEEETIESDFVDETMNGNIHANNGTHIQSAPNISDVQADEPVEDDEHVIYLTERAKQLLAILEPNLEEFIIEVFLNDELEFYKHLENITAYTEWRMAGRYITRDVFDKNRIDLYSEPAVMFTDAVQEFFDQNEN